MRSVARDPDGGGRGKKVREFLKTPQLRWNRCHEIRVLLRM